MARKNKLELTMERFWDALRVNSNHVTKRSYVSFITWAIIFRAVFDLFLTLFKVNVSNGAEK